MSEPLTREVNVAAVLWAAVRAGETEMDRLREALEQIVSPRSGHLSRDALRAIARDALKIPPP